MTDIAWIHCTPLATDTAPWSSCLWHDSCFEDRNIHTFWFNDKTNGNNFNCCLRSTAAARWCHWKSRARNQFQYGLLPVLAVVYWTESSWVRIHSQSHVSGPPATDGLLTTAQRESNRENKWCKPQLAHTSSSRGLILSDRFISVRTLRTTAGLVNKSLPIKYWAI